LEEVDLAGTITLAPDDTKTDEPRLIVLTARAKQAVAALHAPKATGYVFRNPKTKRRWVDVKKRFSARSSPRSSTASGSTTSAGASSPGRAE